MRIEQLIAGFRPETALERELARDPAMLRGLAWGRPRPGNPEGRVGTHVADLLAAIVEPAGRRRSELRFLALVHDALKHQVRPDAAYSLDNDQHGVLARRFAERYTADPRILRTLELHDEPFRIWRTHPRDGRSALDAMLTRVPDLALFVRFVELDGSTRGKDPRPIRWMHGVAADRSAAGLRLAA